MNFKEKDYAKFTVCIDFTKMYDIIIMGKVKKEKV